MSIDHIKKHARTLHKYLPTYFAEHPDGGQLSHCLELASRVHGYPSWHAAQSRVESLPESETGTHIIGTASADTSPNEPPPVDFGGEIINSGVSRHQSPGIDTSKDELKYWLVDIGAIKGRDKYFNRSAIVIHAQNSNGHELSNIDANRRLELRKEVKLANEAAHPELIVVFDSSGDSIAYVNNAKEPHRIHLKDGQLKPILDGLKINKAPDVYHRYLLRALYELLGPRGEPYLNPLESLDPSKFVPYDRDEFMRLISWYKDAALTVNFGRIAGPRLILEEGSVIFEVLVDIGRGRPDYEKLLDSATISPSLYYKHKVFNLESNKPDAAKLRKVQKSFLNGVFQRA